MKRAGIMGMAGAAAIVASSACAPQPEMEEPAVREEPTALMDIGPCKGDLDQWALVIAGTPLEELLAGRPRLDTLRPFLAEWHIDVDDDALPALLERIKQGEAIADDRNSPFHGIGGFHKLLVAEIALAPNDDQEEQRVICGKIRDYIFDEATGSGHLTVDTRIDIYNSAASFSAGTPDSVERYHWDIDVNGVYKVIPRDDNNPDDPFQNTVDLPDAAKDPSNRDGIWLRGGRPGLDHKLFAKGRDVVVRNVYRKFDNGSIVRYDDATPHPFYVSTDESCIDLLTKGRPPATLDDLPPQPGYCLGRCDHPQVVNTH